MPADDMLSDDMLSGEEEEGQEGQRRGGRAAEQPSDEDEEEEDEEEEDDEEGWGAGRGRDLLAESDSEEGEEDDELAPSAHEQRQQRMQQRIRCACRGGCERGGPGCKAAGLWVGRLASVLLPPVFQACPAHTCHSITPASCCSKLEEEALGTKDWFMRGEVEAGAAALGAAHARRRLQA